MTGTNHALSGAFIATIYPNTLVVVLVAFLSHYALDALPHFGEVFGERNNLSKSIWIIDLILVACFLTYIIINMQFLLVLGAVVAMSPDFAWVYRFAIQEKFGKLPPKPLNKFNKLHENIQKFESRKGLFVEFFWVIIFSLLLTKSL